MKISANGRGFGQSFWKARGPQIAVIIGALLVAAYIGYRPSGRIGQLIAVAGLGLLLVILFSRYLPWALTALVPIAFLIDIKIKTGTKVVFNVTYLFLVFVLATWLVRKIIFEKRLRLSPSPANLPAILFIVACLLGWLSSVLPWVPVATIKPGFLSQMGAFLLYALSMGAMLMAADTWKNLMPIRFFTWSYIILGMVFLSVMVVSRSYVVTSKWFVDALYGSSVFWTLLAALAAGQALFNRKLWWPMRIGLLVAVAVELIFMMTVRSNWVSGWLPPLVAVAILAWLWDWRVGLVLSAIAMIMAPDITSFVTTEVNTSTQQWSSFTRYATWPIVYKLILINPLTGLGPATYNYYTEYFNFIGYFVQFNTHNNYFDIILQSGLIGLSMFIWLIVVILRLGWQARRWVMSDFSDGFSNGYVNSILAGLVAILVSGAFADWFLPYVYNIGIPGFQGSLFIWLFVGGLISIFSIYQKQVNLP